MRPIEFDPKDVLAPFYRHKVLTKEQHLKLCGCSAMTAWRAMNEHGYLSSYNYNATYYTLVDIPEFDERGLWSYRKIRFSRFKSLPCTMSELIDRSASGMSAGEVDHMLTLNNARATLSRLSKQGKLNKEKLSGRLIYFSPTPERFQQQRHQRKTEGTMPVAHAQLPEPDQIIAALVERILHPNMDTRRLTQRLRRKGLKINHTEVEATFVYYGVEKKSTGAGNVAC